MSTKQPVNDLPRLTLKQKRWLKCYTDVNCAETFGNATAAAKAANYRARTLESFQAIGCENLRKLMPYLERWYEEAGLSDAHLMRYLTEGLQATETKFFSHDGVVTETRALPNWRARREFLDIALRVKGLYQAEKKELSTKNGKPLVVVDAPPQPATMEEWEQQWNAYQERQRKTEQEAG